MGRDAADDEVVCRFQVCVTDDKEKARAIVRMAFGGYLSAPVYNKFIEWCGYEKEAKAIAAGFATRDLRNGLEAFVSGLLEGNEVALVTFGGPPRILVESTDRLDRLRDGIGRIFAFSDSAAYLLDTLVETARGFERRASPRPVIVIVTSEGIDYSRHSSESVLEALQASRVATHAIVLKDRATTALRASRIGDVDLANSLYQRDLVLERGPRSTGGQRRDLLMSTGTRDALDRLAGILTSQYEVVYSRPASLIPPEQIAVRMRRNDLTARGTPVRRTGG